MPIKDKSRSGKSKKNETSDTPLKKINPPANSQINYIKSNLNGIPVIMMDVKCQVCEKGKNIGKWKTWSPPDSTIEILASQKLGGGKSGKLPVYYTNGRFTGKWKIL